jgi:hypothetical protein
LVLSDVSRCVAWLSVCTVASCAAVEPGEIGSEPNDKVMSVACADNLTPQIGVLNWKLRVTPTQPIRSGESFIATLGGTATFSEAYLDAGQAAIPGGLQEVNLVDLKATVHVRSGAVGADVTLRAEEIPYECNVSRTPCDPANDLPGVPGARGNRDCQPEGTLNPCGRFVRAPTSSDCNADGPCAALGKTGPGSQCELNGFCITGEAELPLEERVGSYVAEDEGEVLFGWADESTGARIRESGPNAGTWILPEAVYEEPIGLLGVRATVVGIPIATECTMGVDSRGPLGVDSLDLLSSPTPDSALISFPIENAP